MLSNETIVEVIEDYRNRIPPITPRLININKIKGRATTIIGLRRSGKTSFLQQEMQKLIKDGVSLEQILFINFEDDRLDITNQELLKRIFDVFHRISPENTNKKKYVFFDEIQEVPNWEKFVRRIIDTETVEIYLTGSSSKLLSKEIATSMRGRAISTEFFPFSFKEYLLHHKHEIVPQNKINKKMRAIYENESIKFLQTTAFPELVDLEPNLRFAALKDYLDVIILRDIVERHKVSSVHALRQLVRQTMTDSAKLFSVNKFFADLKSRGFSIGKETCLTFLDYLEDAFALFLVPQFSRSERVQQTQVKKVYAGDLGFIQLFNREQENKSHLLETAVFLNLRRHLTPISYYKSKTGKEVDFTFNYKEKRYFIQASWSMQAPETRTREIKALIEASQEFKKAKFIIITASESETITIDDITIEVVPVWMWFLYGL